MKDLDEEMMSRFDDAGDEGAAATEGDAIAQASNMARQNERRELSWNETPKKFWSECKKAVRKEWGSWVKYDAVEL